MAFKSRDLLDQLADLQLTLEGYSLQQLSVEEANALKKSFEEFRDQLESRLWNPKGSSRQDITGTPSLHSGDAEALIAAVSHDIRIPLNGIKGYTDLLLEGPLDPRQKQYVEVIHSASRTLCSILNELVLFSRLKDGSEDAVRIVFSPEALLNEAAQFARMLLKDKPVTVESDFSQGLPDRIAGDPSKLLRILMNLLENAAKYVHTGKVKLSARAVRKHGLCTLVLEVSDSGIGIPGDELPHIFKPYYQAKQEGSTAGQGHGLGLSIVKKLVEQQDGRIEVRSLEGRGSTFKVQLPYSCDDRALPGESGAEEDRFAGGKDLQGVRVLLFEDNPMNATLMIARLEQWGCTVHQASRVPLGIKVLEEEPIDLILMDLRMPQMDGFQATRRIRTHKAPEIRRIPVLAVTADFTAAESEQYRDSGIDDVLLKPYDPRELHTKMARLCRPGPPTVTNGLKSGPVGGNHNSEQQVLSLDYLVAECMGDMKVLEDMVGMFRNSLLEFAGKMKLFVPQEDYPAIAEAAHKVITGLKMVRAEKLLQLAEEIHQVADSRGPRDRIALAYDQFLCAFPGLLNALEEELDQRKNSGR